jgi:hypothetical protein
VIARAEALRQEILEAAQSEQNAQTALKLARIEYLARLHLRLHL